MKTENGLLRPQVCPCLTISNIQHDEMITVLGLILQIRCNWYIRHSGINLVTPFREIARGSRPPFLKTENV